jgi:hypothetical protein
MDLRQAIDHTLLTFRNKAILTRRETWQGLKVWDRPEMVTHELTHHSMHASLHGRVIKTYANFISPDLPWADEHFQERVSGRPLNPPPSEERWPHAQGANDKFKHQGLFSHTYPERFWPKEAGHPSHPRGIRYPIADFTDFVNLLKREPYTRQAYFPIFFPEDTGNVSRVRTPCTLGYHLLLTGDTVDITYYMRSCDLRRHFRNDIYFAVRFLLEVLERLGRTNPWPSVKPGTLHMHIASLHIFRNDFRTLFGEHK